MDASVVEVLFLAIHEHRTEQLVQGVAPQPERWLRLRGPLMQPAAGQLGAGELLQQRGGPIRRSQGHLARQSLFEAKAGVGAQPDTAGAAPHGLGAKTAASSQMLVVSSWTAAFAPPITPARATAWSA